MSVYFCELCDQLLDGDHTLPYEWEAGWICENCDIELEAQHERTSESDTD